MLDVEVLYAEYADTLRNYLMVRCRDWHLAEDLTNETFVRVLVSRRYQERDKVSGWLFTIAQNLLTDRFRAAKYRSDTVSLPALIGTLYEPSVTYRFDELGERDRVAQAIEHLPESQQRVLRARYWDDRKFGEMPEVGNENTVKHLDRRARASLRPYLEMSA